MTPIAIVAVLLVVMSIAACGDADQDSSPSPSPTATAGGQDARPSGGTAIRITFGDTELSARLLDNATARDLAARLPLTLNFRDHNGAEKTASLPAQLSTDGAPDGHDPGAGDIGYYAPAGDFVLYYDDAAPYFDGIIRIGEFQGDLAALAQQTDGVRIKVELVG